MMARRRFFVDAVHRDTASIEGEEAAHLTRVLRVEAGQRFEISDNHSVWLAEVVEARKSLVAFHVIEPVKAGATPLPIELYAALFKFDRFEWMVEKATELGVASIIPVETGRSEHGLFAAAHKRVERWRKIARESSQQSRRDRLPEIREPLKLCNLDANGTRFVLDEAPGTAPLKISDEWNTTQTISLLLGPEGGWTDDERAALSVSSWTRASLGPTVLRAETAAIAALAIVSHEIATRAVPAAAR